MPKLSEVENLFLTLTGGDEGWNRHAYPKLVERFRRFGSFEDGDEISLSQVITGVARSVSALQFGLFIDWNESVLLREKCWGLVEYTVGLPDEYWHEPDRYTVFKWDGDDVSDGLTAFDRWLATENVEFRGDVPWRLVNVDTGSDFYLALLCTEDCMPQVIEQLSGLGLLFIPLNRDL